MLKIVRTDAYDFVVCGGGMAGVTAAIAAGRKGLRVALVERLGCLGGVATSGGVCGLLGGRKLNEETGEHVRVIGGLFDEITDQLIARGKAIEPNTIDLAFNPFEWYPRMASCVVFDAEEMKVLLERMCEDCGVRIYYNTALVDAVVDGRRVRAVYAHNKDGLIGLEAALFADCTGDADLACMCGVPCRVGRAGDHLTAPASLIMHVDGVDGNELVRYQNEHQSPKLVEIIESLKRRGIWRFPYEIFIGKQLMEKDVFLINTIRQLRVDGTSERSVTRALIQGRAESLALFEIIKQYFPGFAHARIRRIFDWLGVRESRRIAGLYEITVSDALGGKKYGDRIGATTYNFDLPDPLKPSYDPMMGSSKNPNPNRAHVVIQIPYRSLLPAGIENLIAAGRLISAQREALGALRVMGPCMQMGQAAGTAAALAAACGGAFGAVDVEKLQSVLWRDGVLDPDELPFP